RNRRGAGTCGIAKKKVMGPAIRIAVGKMRVERRVLCKIRLNAHTKGRRELVTQLKTGAIGNALVEGKREVLCQVSVVVRQTDSRLDENRLLCPQCTPCFGSIDE